jgi:hypothetical protein
VDDMVPGAATNGMARVRVNIPGWDRIDLVNPSFEIKIEDGRQPPGGLIQPPKEILLKSGCLKSRGEHARTANWREATGVSGIAGSR